MLQYINMKTVFIRIACIYIALSGLYLSAETDKIVLGIHHNPPFTYVEQNECRGFVVDILKDFCKKHNFKFQCRQGTFHQLLKMLQENRIDVLAPLGFTEEREKYISFSSEAIITSWANLITPYHSSYRTLRDLNQKTIGVVKGDHYYGMLKEDTLKNKKLHFNFKEYPSFTQIVDDIVANKIDGGLILNSSLTHILNTHKIQDKIRILPKSLYPTQLYIGINRTKSALLKLINQYLEDSGKDSRSLLRQSREHWFKAKPFQPVDLEFLIYILIIASVVFSMVSVFTIVMRKRVKIAVREIVRQKSYFENLFRTIPVGIAILDRDNLIVDANEEFCSMFEFSLEEIKGKNIDDIIVGQDRIEEANYYTEKTKVGERVFLESIRLTKHHQRIDTQIIGAPIVNEGELLGIIAIYIDRTEQKKMEREILKSKNIESLGVLAGGIAHDFNNLLTGIIGNISIASRAADSGRVTKPLDNAKAAADRATALTKQLLTFSKGGIPLKRVVSITDIVKESMDICLSGSSIDITLEIDKKIPNVEVDVGQISQVINNILINAKQAIIQNGKISVAIRNHLQEQNSGFLPRGNHICISIEDNGVGITDENLDKIFTPYFTTKEKGSGLGLSISYSIIKRHNGNIRVNSSWNKGTRFEIFLPATDKAKEKEEILQPLKVEPSKILLMDDEEIVRNVFEDMLNEKAFRVDVSADSQEAIKKYREALESNEKYDLIFLDLVIPGDIGGIKTLEKLLEIDPEVNAVATSGYSEKMILVDPLRFKFRDFLAKPFSLDQLLDSINKNLRTKKRSLNRHTGNN